MRESFEKNIERHKTFSVLIEKEVIKIDKDSNENVVTISYKVKFIECTRFMTILLSNLVDNLTEGIHKIMIAFLDMKLSRTIQWNINTYLAIKIIQTKLMKN